MQLRAVVLDLTGEGLDADREQEGQAEDDRGMAEGEPEPDRERLRLARPASVDVVGEQLAGGVVDRGDVVGVEGVPQAEGVGQHADPDAVDAGGPPELVALGHDQEEQDAEPDDVQDQDEPEHAAQHAPVVAIDDFRNCENGGFWTSRVKAGELILDPFSARAPA